MNFLGIYLGEEKDGGGGLLGTHSHPLLQNRFMDVYKTW